MRSKLPSPPVILVTAVVGCCLAVGGFVLGKSSDSGKIPASIPVQPMKQPDASDPIVVPSDVDLPRR